jgi:hypothetical protein
VQVGDRQKEFCEFYQSELVTNPAGTMIALEFAPALLTSRSHLLDSSIVCEHLALTKVSTVIELPGRSISSVAELYWVTPCWLAALPVLTACEPVGQMLALSPVLLAENDGEALPLCMRLSEKS